MQNRTAQLLAFSLCLVCSTAYAAEIARISGTANVFFILPYTAPGGAQYPYPGAAPGDTMTFEFTYDMADPSDGPYIPSDPLHSNSFSPILSVRLSYTALATGQSFVHEMLNITESTWDITDYEPGNPDGVDTHNIRVTADGAGIPEAAVTHFNFVLTDFTNTGITSLDLPSSPISMDDFPVQDRFLGYGVGHLPEPGPEGTVWATPQTFTWTPEPSTLSLLGLAMLVCVRRKRRKCCS